MNDFDTFLQWWEALENKLDEAGLPGILLADASLHYLLGHSVEEAFEKIRDGNERSARTAGTPRVAL